MNVDKNDNKQLENDKDTATDNGNTVAENDSKQLKTDKDTVADGNEAVTEKTNTPSISIEKNEVEGSNERVEDTTSEESPEAGKNEKVASLKKDEADKKESLKKSENSEDSENNSDSRSSKHSNSTSGSKLLMVAIVLLFVVIIAGCFVGYQYVKLEQAANVDPDTAGVELVKKNRETALAEISSAIGALRDKSIIINVQDSTNQVTMLYNSNHEAIAESPETGYKTVYMEDSRAIQFSDNIGYGYDSEVLTLLELASKLALEDKNIPVLRSNGTGINDSDGDTSEELGEVTEYLIDIRGWDNINTFYSLIDENLASIMVDSLKGSVELAAEQTDAVTADSELNLRFMYLISNGCVETGACYIYFGDKPSGEVTWKELSYSWLFQSYLEIYDWKLDEKWYTLDWENITEWEDTNEAEDLFIQQYTDILDVLNQFATDNGMEGLVYDISTSGSGLEDNLSEASGEVETNNTEIGVNNG